MLVRRPSILAIIAVCLGLLTTAVAPHLNGICAKWARLPWDTEATLNVLQRKGRVRRKLVGRAYEYSAIVSQETADSHAIKDVLQKVFRGSVDDLLLSLVRSKHLDARKLAELQAKLETGESGEEEPK